MLAEPSRLQQQFQPCAPQARNVHHLPTIQRTIESQSRRRPSQHAKILETQCFHHNVGCCAADRVLAAGANTVFGKDNDDGVVLDRAGRAGSTSAPGSSGSSVIERRSGPIASPECESVINARAIERYIAPAAGLQHRSTSSFRKDNQSSPLAHCQLVSTRRSDAAEAAGRIHADDARAIDVEHSVADENDKT